MQLAKTCATCRHAATDKRPRVVGATGFGDQIEFGDDDEVTYACVAPGGEREGEFFGNAPVTCESWEPPRKEKSARLEELDRMIAEREARTRAGGDE